jgi:hypothetical protein
MGDGSGGKYDCTSGRRGAPVHLLSYPDAWQRAAWDSGGGQSYPLVYGSGQDWHAAAIGGNTFDIRILFMLAKPKMTVKALYREHTMAIQQVHESTTAMTQSQPYTRAAH